MALRRHLALIAGLAGLVVAMPAAAQEFSNPVGAEAYAVSCANCHGATGHGDGDFALMMTVKPPDLTTLSARNDGVFPYMDVFRTVDGRTPMSAHGTRMMPIWGNYFARPVDGAQAGLYSSELIVRTRITALVDYIETLQE